MIIGVTGPKGAGKSSVLIRLVEFLSSQGLSLGGIISQSDVKNGSRTGYLLRTVADNQVYPLAAIDDAASNGDPKPGMRRYARFLFHEDALVRGNQAILDGLSADCLFVDEIGLWETYDGGWHLQMHHIARRRGLTFLGLSPKIIPHLGPLWGISLDHLFTLTKNVIDATFQQIVMEALVHSVASLRIG